MTIRLIFAALLAGCMAGTASAAQPDWITKSNEYSNLLMEVQARYSPESASTYGVEGHDADVMDLKPRNTERQEADLVAVEEKLAAARSQVRDVRVKQDLDILIESAANQRQTLQIERRLLIPFFDLPKNVFFGFNSLLHEGISAARQKQAVLRLHRYVGGERGVEPIAVLARARIEETFKNPALVAPWSVELQQSLDNQPRYLAGIHDLFKKSGLKGWETDFKRLSQQFEAYGQWLRSDLLPRARSTNRLPEEVYANNLRNYGVMANPREVMQQALTAYAQIREELATVAGIVAQQRGMKSTNYIDVIHELKKERLPKDRILELNRSRLKEIEAIIRREHIATLPEREAVIRFGSEAESAGVPAPHIDVPPLIGNTGQPAAFVIPASNPNSHSTEDYDDFSFDAITWTLLAHEARPGHELQISRMLEQGVSTARAVFAFNSANVEGWALYAEAVMKKYFSLPAQVSVLQWRMGRAARAFLDPMVNLGLIEPDAVKELLMKEVGFSEPMAKQEVDRYTFNSPGQATAYFYGYQLLSATRARAEIALGDRFDPLSFHDFILNQGLLPLHLLDKAVMEDYVPSRRR